MIKDHQSKGDNRIGVCDACDRQIDLEIPRSKPFQRGHLASDHGWRCERQGNKWRDVCRTCHVKALELRRMNSGSIQ